MTDQALAMQLLQTLGLSTWNDETQSDDVDSSQVTEVLAAFDAIIANGNRSAWLHGAQQGWDAAIGDQGDEESLGFDDVAAMCPYATHASEQAKPEPQQPSTRELEQARDAVIAAARLVDSPPYGGMTEARVKLREALTELEKRIGGE